ncbi:MAG: excinuclease ABC subunit UvrB [Chitinophagales bacterium]|nr:excinuclease ABC subunit UvrB [Bacteroidota bacterium]MCB9042997.1 excinuclease ABC subunit UvrB [Chitinophagales bacterium]
MPFEIKADFLPTGDQPQAIEQLLNGLENNEKYQTLLGVTGSGKTFTMANVIQQWQKPTLILSHNKTLVAQLYGEFKQFFPNNAVEYFVSYYDYYQPEAYIAVSDTYIEKDLSINAEVEKLRLKATTSLLSGRRDVIVVASVSCIYGLGNPADFKESIIRLSVGTRIARNQLLHNLVMAQYSRNEVEFERSNFRVRGDTIDIFLPYADYACRIIFFGDEIEQIETFDPETGNTIASQQDIAIFPANMYVTPQEYMLQLIHSIQDELLAQETYFKQIGKHAEAKRIKERVEFDLEMIRELGYCSGIENYSRFIDRRLPGDRPFCLLDYFPDDYLLIIDESHVTLPQIKGMYGGDRARKMSLVEYGFRLPSALDNRPLNFDEFLNLLNQAIFVSATPADFELTQTDGVVVEQLIRPTGLLDPPIVVRPSINQIDDLIGEINTCVEKKERALVTTLTKRMAEELSKYFSHLDINCRYIHSDVDTLERIEIIRDLRLGSFDVLIGVNLLREGLDLPEVSLVAILDADKEGFLRNERSLIQTAGRAARNANGKVIMYADKITQSMQRAIDETERKRQKQIAYNQANNILPTTVKKSREQILQQTSVLDIRQQNSGKAYVEKETPSVAADPIVQYMSKAQLDKSIEDLQTAMKAASAKLDFIEAARLRDEMYALQQILKEKFSV